MKSEIQHSSAFSFSSSSFHRPLLHRNFHFPPSLNESLHTWLNRINPKFRASSLYCAFTAQWFQLSDIRFTSLADTIIIVNSNSTIKLNKWIVQTHDIKTHSLCAVCFSFFALPVNNKKMFQFSSCLKFDFLMPFFSCCLYSIIYFFFNFNSLVSSFNGQSLWLFFTVDTWKKSFSKIFEDFWKG